LQKKKKNLAQQSRGALISPDMKKIFLTIQFAALMAGLPAFALVGGPFDNGDYSILNERNGYYQSSFTFKNGNGYAIWTADNLQGTVVQGGSLTPNVSTGSLITPAPQGSHNANRSVFYYKGVTYFGSAMGQVDMEARSISGYCNANSEYETANAQAASGGQFALLATTVTNTSTVVASGRSYIANANWTGKITSTTPQVRFTGDGELVIIAPSGTETIAGLAYNAFQGLLDSIVASVAASGQSIFGVTPGLYADAQAAISGALSGTGAIAATPATITPVFTYSQAIGPDPDGTGPLVGTAVDVNGDGIFNNDLVPSGTATGAGNTASTPAQNANPGAPGLDDYLTGTGPSASYDESERVKVQVTGYRRYF
jgi:hypothetical protein